MSNLITITKKDFNEDPRAIERTFGNKSAKKWLTACTMVARALNSKLPKGYTAVLYNVFASQYRKVLSDKELYKKELNRTGHVLVLNEKSEIIEAIDVRTFDNTKYSFGTVTKDGLLNKAIETDRWSVHISNDYKEVKFTKMGILKNDVSTNSFYKSNIFKYSEEQALEFELANNQQQDVELPFAEQHQQLPEECQ